MTVIAVQSAAEACCSPWPPHRWPSRAPHRLHRLHRRIRWPRWRRRPGRTPRWPRRCRRCAGGGRGRRRPARRTPSCCRPRWTGSSPPVSSLPAAAPASTTPPAPPRPVAALRHGAGRGRARSGGRAGATLPPYRAGLVGSVAAGCASLRGGAGVTPESTRRADGARRRARGGVDLRPGQRVPRPQQAAAVAEGANAHRARRDATERLAARRGRHAPTRPQPPTCRRSRCTDAASALAALVAAEPDTCARVARRCWSGPTTRRCGARRWTR